MQILKGHLSTKPVRSLAFAPDSTKLASSARDYKTFLWDLATGKYQVIDERASFTVTFSPDGRTIATGRASGLSLYDIPSGTLREIHFPHELGMFGHGWDLAYSPDGKVLVGVSGGIRRWNAHTLEELPFLKDGYNTSNCLAFSTNGATLATGQLTGLDGHKYTVRLWTPSTWEIRGELKGPTATIDSVTFSPNGKYLAACACTTLWVWEVASGNVILKHAISKQHYKDLAFSPDGLFLAFARNDGSISFFSTATWSEVAAYDWKVGPIISLAIAPDGMRAAGGSGKGKIVVFDVDL